MKRILQLIALMSLFTPLAAFAESGFTALTVTPTEGGGQTYSVTIQVLALMTALTFLPAALMMMTSFTRIIIVLAILRQALGTMNTPSNQILIGLTLFLTVFIMWPVFERIHDEALQPYLQEQITLEQGVEKASIPLREFMLRQTREDDIALFTRISGRGDIETPEDVPFSILVPSFVTSELKTAFQIGFLIFLPFLIIDLVVASVLMSMGMMMLSPMIISMPFKIMLFVLIDGWSLITGTLASSFYV
ncbi:flagellar biosynthetic protein FliP [Solemya pervernicosa gill symbiont]|uniref:Flagellar biosynthetic protein FliP n=1 Tax=Solemya pervernicosa gill symbiont TaxID=642797 RepID=A0A1T2LAR3_9GAMM|nr:flagellar type III secretion system pore protein FliP [Solemya pervernicosa gill symbiont]OOZ42134.1 flagellar biosynthetic protein FliP [Solemya pervernicosa gill symbiont]